MADYHDYIAYFNGEWLPYRDVKVVPEDRGFMVADVVFDIARTFGGKSFRLNDHIDRLYRSLKYVRIDPELSPDEMTELCEQAVMLNIGHQDEAGDFAINPWVTRGQTLDGPPTVCISIKPVNFPSFAKYYDEGAHGVIVKSRSYANESMEPKVKHHSRLNFNMAELEARDIDPDGQAVLLDKDGNVTEGIGYNVFIVKDGVLKTPTDRSILQGISRGVVIEVAENLGIPVVEEDLQPYDLYTADEAFFSRTSPRIVPVSQLDRRPVGEEFPGPITKNLLAAHSELVGVDIVGQAQHYAGIKE